MKLTNAERLILDNQRAIMYALVSRSPINKSMLRSRIELTGTATLVPPKKRKRRPVRNTGAFSGDVGDQGY